MGVFEKCRRLLIEIPKHEELVVHTLIEEKIKK